LDESYASERKRKWAGRAVAAILGGAFVVWAGMHLPGNPYLVFPIVGVAIGLVYVFDLPELMFAALRAARLKVAGVEHAGRHEWYGFKGRRVRLFLDEGGAPWFAVKDVAPILDIADAEDALRHYGAAEVATLSDAHGEQCLSEAGLRRLLAHAAHPEAGALTLWLDREVLLPLRHRGGR
jgi:hypothetical protein